MDVEEIVETYIRFRDKVKAIKEAAEKAAAPYKQAMEALENALHQHMLDNKVKSMPTKSGTPYLAEQTSVQITDWEAAIADIRERGEVANAVEKRLSKQWMKEQAEEGRSVPGAELISYLKVNIRRNS